jgi:hypothetical protein
MVEIQRPIPNRIAQIHLMRTAGTTVSAYLGDVLSNSGYEVCNSWFDGLERDWTPCEMASFCDSNDSIFVHNHVRSWTRRLVDLYQACGFFVFAYVRPIGDQLSSLYCWARDRTQSDFKIGLDEFLQQQLRGEESSGLSYRDWAIPEYWAQLDFVESFSQSSFRHLVQEALAQPWDCRSKWAQTHNASDNPGYEYLCTRRLIGKETQLLLAESVYQQRFEAIRRRSLAAESAPGRDATRGKGTDCSGD